MDAEPLVSVVLIFFNAERFIEQTIRSVLDQSYAHWELLLVDDGSTDGSSAIARHYAGEHPQHIRYLEHPGHANRGMSASRNAGIRACAGPYVALLDADDVWLPHKLRQQVRLMEEHPRAGMVYGRAQQWFSWTGAPEDRDRDYVQDVRLETDRLYEPGELLPQYVRRRAATACPADVLLRREAIESVGGFEEQFTGICQLYEDQACFAKVCWNWPVYVARECWTKYRRHDQSCVAQVKKAGQAPAARRFFLAFLEQYLAGHGGRGSESWRALREQLWPLRHPGLAPVLAPMKRLMGGVRRLPRQAASRLLPAPLKARLRAWRRGQRYCPPVGHVDLASLRRLEPLSRHWGSDRGLPIDRYYIEWFLAEHAQDVAGRVLEVGTDVYMRRFGGSRVTRRDVLHVEGCPSMTIRADLARAEQLPADAFDCFICTQTLQFIYDVPAAVRTIHRLLKPGGVLLATVSGISQVSPRDMRQWGDYWRFTTCSVRRLFEAAFPGEALEVRAYGNVLTAAGFLYGLAAGELRPEELDHHDPHYELVVTVRACKPVRVEQDLLGSAPATKQEAMVS